MSRLGDAVHRTSLWLRRPLSRLGDSFRRSRFRLRRLFWDEIDPVVRGVVLSLLTVGVLLSVMGGALDLAGIWGSFPFSVNMVSSAAAACFGVPIALVVLQYLLHQQEEHSSRIRITHRAIAASTKMSELARRQTGDQGRRRVIQERLMDLRNPLRAEAHKLSALLAISAREVDKLDGLHATLNLLLNNLADIKATIPDQATRDAVATDLASTWRYLDEQLYPMSLDVGLPWIGPDVRPPASWDPWEYVDSYHYTVRRFLDSYRRMDDIEELRRELFEVTRIPMQMFRTMKSAEKLSYFVETVESELRQRLGLQPVNG